ncbi:MAG: hypothetical protein ACLGJD_06635 [Gammaproteobacteria bacterium]|uniref:hypothetical protein n=1 Tax=Pseudacidovorax sp. TaxID=1934311 RepID=UPI001B3F6AE2|nr:hypothetical protein [Pseudacidovorax sp.]MBP6895453.1 hypothetical protein [Pseudacidovorax sp.]
MHDAPVTPLPVALATANTALALRTFALLQQAGREAWERRLRLLSDTEEDAVSQVGHAANTGDWQALGAWPADLLWRGTQRNLEAWRTLVQGGLASQTELAQGLREAWAQWQKSTAAALAPQGRPKDGA